MAARTCSTSSSSSCADAAAAVDTPKPGHFMTWSTAIQTSFLCALESIMTKGKFGTVLSTSYSCLHISMEHSSCCLDATERKWYLLAEICRLNSRTKYQKRTRFRNTLIKAYLGMFCGGKVGITCKRTVQVSRRISSALLVHVSSSLSAGSLALMISLVRDASRLKVPTDLHLQTHPTKKQVIPSSSTESTKDRLQRA